MHWLSISELSEALAAKKLSPVELATALLDRAARHDGILHAFIRLDADQVYAQAKMAEAEISSGGWRGPLHGIPVALKDVIDVEGVPTTCHSAILIDNIAAEDAAVTCRLRASGAVLFGKLATHEFAIGGPSFDLPWPPARNPWNPACHPGGSSSGAGAGLAGGLFPAAVGTDTAGSVRNPASACGIVGMKPTYDRVSRKGVFPLSFSMDHVGPMTRNVRDNALLLTAIMPKDRSEDFSRDIGRGVRGLRIGTVRRWHQEGLEADAEMEHAFEQAVARLSALGASITEINPGPLETYAAVAHVIRMSEAYAIHENWLKSRPQDYSKLSRERILPGAFYTAADYIQALRQRSLLVQQWENAASDVDVALTLSSFEPACRIDDLASFERSYTRQARAPFNLTGHPALAMPTGFSADGMPLSIQVVGHSGQEATVYRVAEALERELALSDRHPTGFS